MAKPPPDPLYTFRGNMEIIHCMLIWKNESSEYILAGTGVGLVHVWELLNYREAGKIKVSDHGCLAISQDHEKKEFLTQEKGGVLKLWATGDTILNWSLMKVIELDYVGFCKSVFSCGVILAPAHESKVVVIHSDKRVELVHSNKDKNRGEVVCLKYLKDTDSVMVAYECGDLAVWCTHSGKETTRILLTSDQPMAFDFSELTSEGVLGSNSTNIIKFEFVSGTIRIVRQLQITNSGVSAITIRSDGKLCVIGCWDGRIRYCSMKSLKLLAVLNYHKESVECVVFSNEKLQCCGDRTLLAAGGKDGRITLWTLYSE